MPLKPSVKIGLGKDDRDWAAMRAKEGVLSLGKIKDELLHFRLPKRVASLDSHLARTHDIDVVAQRVQAPLAKAVSKFIDDIPENLERLSAAPERGHASD